jgi:hypothetical protein
VPPLAASVAENETFTVPPGSDIVVIEGAVTMLFTSTETDALDLFPAAS